jgi:hypothetical protein
MRWLTVALLALAACGEPSSVRRSPTDRFVFPSAVALTARQDGGAALVVASGNYDLTYDGADGGTVISVRPELAADGGSARPGGGALVKLGEGANVASFTGELVVADAATCPGYGTAARPPEALVTTRFADQVWRLPLGLDGSLGPCPGGACTLPVEPLLHDPFGLALACRPDGQRRSAFVGYLRTARLGGPGLGGWIAQVDLDDSAAASRTIQVGDAALSGMAYDGASDRLFVLAQPFLSAPVYLVDLTTCPLGLAACPEPAVTLFDLATAQAGLDLQSIALSNPQAGLRRRAYVSARVYDPSLAAIIGVRPAADIGAVLLVLDVEENGFGRPALTLLRQIDVGLGVSQVKVLPVRPPVAGVPQRDVVVVSSAGEGVVTVYDDDLDLARYIPLDSTSGAPEAGRSPFGLAAQLLPGATPADDVARVYVAASQAGVVGIIDVPLAQPDQARALRDATTGTLVRIGGLQ